MIGWFCFLLDDLIGWFCFLLDDLIGWFCFLLHDLILCFCYNNVTQETGGFELASTITLVLQGNQLTKCMTWLKKGKLRSYYWQIYYRFKKICFFLILSGYFILPSQYSFPKFQLQFLLNCVSIYISSKSVSQISKIIIQTGNINIFVHHGVVLSYNFN